MSHETVSESEASSAASSPESTTQNPGPKSSSTNKKKSSKFTKPRLTASQKNTNHKDAENKRRNAIRERFTELSNMVPGAEGQERSEQVMLGKTTDFLKDMLQEQRKLEALAEQQGIVLNQKEKIKDTDYGGQAWKQPNLDAYQAGKAKQPPSDGGRGSDA